MQVSEMKDFLAKVRQDKLSEVFEHVLKADLAGYKTVAVNSVVDEIPGGRKTLEEAGFKVKVVCESRISWYNISWE